MNAKSLIDRPIPIRPGLTVCPSAIPVYRKPRWWPAGNASCSITRVLLAQMIAEYTVKEVPVVGTVKLGAWYHDFESQRGNTDYGDEIDLLISIEPVKGVAIEAKFADYHGRGGFADLERAWFGVEYTY
jgi:hypothetical protein